MGPEEESSGPTLFRARRGRVEVRVADDPCWKGPRIPARIDRNSTPVPTEVHTGATPAQPPHAAPELNFRPEHDELLALKLTEC